MNPATADDEPGRRVMLRGFCLVSGALALGLTALGWAPGYEIYRDGALERVAPVSSSPYGLVVMLGAMAALAAHVWHRPLLANALLGSIASIGASVFMLALTASPFEPGGEVVARPAAAIADQLALALVFVQIVLLPAACGLHAYLAHARRPERIARARVHRIGRG
jgi:hypothetical protein